MTFIGMLTHTETLKLSVIKTLPEGTSSYHNNGVTYQCQHVLNHSYLNGNDGNT